MSFQTKAGRRVTAEGGRGKQRRLDRASQGLCPRGFGTALTTMRIALQSQQAKKRRIVIGIRPLG